MFQATTQSNEESLTIPEMEGHSLEHIKFKHCQQATCASIVDQTYVQGNVAI